MPFDSLPTEKPETDEARWVREAMDVIRDRDKWTKGRLYCEGRHCMAGAVMRGMGMTVDEVESGDDLCAPPIQRIIPERVVAALNIEATRRSGRLEYFWGYNDLPTTSHEDVMAVMQAAYETLRWGDSQ